MKRKIIGIFVCMLLIAIAMTPLVSSIKISTQTNVSPGVVDQKQELTSNLQWLQGGVPHWQEFVNQGNVIEEVEVHIGHYFSGSYPMTLSIEETVGATPLTSATLTTANIPDHVQDWCTFDVTDVKLNRGQKYYIVIRFDPGSEYAWSGAAGNPYPDGESSVGPNWDYAFRTIVDKSKPININTLFLRFLENHPHMFPILRQLMGL